ncbi:hypothetical protein [Anaerotruncus sp. 1XD42-93]|jgi:hypothetical protein|uniref:hypothetical protein n=1 Tax=Anaerotruncus sp. 1XD42-93 TaxID=2320853 RepID=UPI000EA359AD|nr:hypothetical protein [Anaerotruncus sp. 1XD42-93]MCI9235526.1 DUF2493 domain-containing protein [Anaerotruncus sp.]NBK17090.1 hypothetical protein [Anaerotruncus sp. 1XD42-93]NCE73909.1 hypothetical protein [Anaerotruncus sp. X29]RKJ98077.1 hypothetical protein D7Y41_05155 [Anaerotruncus sp. 1XD22-93]
MRIAIVGSRDVKGFTLERMLPHIPPEATELVSGGAYGIDQMAEQAAQILGLPIRIFRPDYKTNGRLAPLVRNRQIVEYADQIYAFWDNQSRGTAYTLKLCIEQDKPFRIIPLK